MPFSPIPPAIPGKQPRKDDGTFTHKPRQQGDGLMTSRMHDDLTTIDEMLDMLRQYDESGDRRNWNRATYAATMLAVGAESLDDLRKLFNLASDRAHEQYGRSVAKLSRALLNQEFADYFGWNAEEVAAAGIARD